MTQINQPNIQFTSNEPKVTPTDPTTVPVKPKSNRGFASMDPARQREIASKGGHASGGNFANNRERAVEAGRKGGQHSSGNFANNRERAADAGRKGGQASSGQRQAFPPVIPPTDRQQ